MLQSLQEHGDEDDEPMDIVVDTAGQPRFPAWTLPTTGWMRSSVVTGRTDEATECM